MISNISKKVVKTELFNVWVHDLRTKDETACFEIKASSTEEAKKFFLEDFQQNFYHIQEIELA